MKSEMNIECPSCGCEVPVTEVLQSQLTNDIRMIQGRADRRILQAVQDLTRRSPDIFEDAIIEAYKDSDNPGRDSIERVLPILGCRMLDNGLANFLADQVVGGDKREKLSAMCILTKAISHCSQPKRMVLFEIAASCYESVANEVSPNGKKLGMILVVNSLLTRFDEHVGLVPRLIGLLGDSDIYICKFALRLLTDRETVSRTTRVQRVNRRCFVSFQRNQPNSFGTCSSLPLD